MALSASIDKILGGFNGKLALPEAAETLQRGLVRSGFARLDPFLGALKSDFLTSAESKG